MGGHGETKTGRTPLVETFDRNPQKDAALTRGRPDKPNETKTKRNETKRIETERENS